MGTGIATLSVAGEPVERLMAFLEELKTDIYPEPLTPGHTEIINQVWSQMLDKYIKPGARILDVGCGQGPALELFRHDGMDATGITLGEDDLKECRVKGFTVQLMDQSFLDFQDGMFDLVWARHVLEHSVMPYWTLKEYERVLKPDGFCYVEVPAPDTWAHHETNPSHFSCFPKSSWLVLFRRSGFALVDSTDILLGAAENPDVYWAFILQKGRV